MKKILLILFAFFYVALMISIGYSILQVTGYFGLNSFIRILIILTVGFFLNFYFPQWAINSIGKLIFGSVLFLRIVFISYVVIFTMMISIGILLGVLMLRNGGYTPISIYGAIVPFVVIASFFGGGILGYYWVEHRVNRIAKS